jgi:hypothetical protein
VLDMVNSITSRNGCSLCDHGTRWLNEHTLGGRLCIGLGRYKAMSEHLPGWHID